MNIFKNEPHALLLGRMLGPQVPSTFIDNGCSGVPDLYLKWPCRIHDYQYWQLRRAWGVIELRLEINGGDIWTSVFKDNLSSGDRYILEEIGIMGHRILIKELIMAHHEYRQLADKYLRANIKTLTRLRVVDGQVRKRPLWSRRLWGRGLNWAFYIVVRIAASRPSKHVDVPTDYDPSAPGDDK